MTWAQGFGSDDSSSQASLFSSNAFPELQQLPIKAKASIWKFLQERISEFESRDEEVPFKIWSLADATRVVDEEEEDDEEGGTEPESEREPYGTILHTACAIGNHWLVQLQIKAGVDVTAVDSHSWTALMVASAQGHSDCTKLLSDYMESIAANPIPQPLPPHGSRESSSDRRQN